MKIAFLIQCHKNPEQVNCLINSLDSESSCFFVHVDKKSDIDKKIIKKENVFLIEKKNRVDVKWATFSQVKATLSLISKASKRDKFDYYCLLSGQDFPIVSVEKIKERFEAVSGANYINLFPSKNYLVKKDNNYDKRNKIVFSDWILKNDKRIRLIRRAYVALTGGYNYTFRIFKRTPPIDIDFYFGSQWWCLTGEFIEYLNAFIKENKSFLDFMAKSSCPDECFFQTIFMNSPFKNTRKEYLHYIDWSNGGSNPKVLLTEDKNKILKSGKLFARKFDFAVDKKIVELIQKEIKK